MDEPRGAQGSECGVESGRLSLGLPKAPHLPHIALIPSYHPEAVSPEQHGQQGLGSEKSVL